MLMSVCPSVPVVVTGVSFMISQTPVPSSTLLLMRQPNAYVRVPWCSGRCNGSVSHEQPDSIMSVCSGVPVVVMAVSVSHE